MKRCIAWLAALVLTMGFIGTARVSAERLNASDKDLIKSAMRDLESGAQESRLAGDRAESAGVKHFAELVVGGNEKLMAELRDFGDKHDLKYTDDPTHPDVRDKKDLEKLHGKEFDRQFMSISLKEHEQMLDLFKQGAKEAKNGDLRDWFAKKVDAVRDHTENARELYRKVKDKE